MNEATPNTKQYSAWIKWADPDYARYNNEPGNIDGFRPNWPGHGFSLEDAMADALRLENSYGSRMQVQVRTYPLNDVVYPPPPAKQEVPPKLPTDDAARKSLPVFRGPLMYFPNALLEVARVCKVGNDQHNPGQPMHWARGKSTEQMDTALRHMMDHGLGNTRDIDGTYHLAKAAWRILAELQLTIERDEGGNS